uniref:TctD transcriptional regulator n=1 Tax=Hommersandiophycus borowitzkae TaxID=268573 RepID=A0A1G4NUG4_9FLOR|nr:Hypothetical protein ycf29 [Hommersandiophycus borowitzkae]SCW22254.1 Hypothetical protein ycf29 [Hommersandiophycus borowitzkae]
MSYRILLVDDDTSLLLSTSSYLLEAGFCTKIVTTVSQAIDALIDEKFDLIIADIVLPCKNGYDLIQYITSNSSLNSIPLIFLTAKGMTKDRILGYDLGCRGYLTKPFDPAELLSIVRNILNDKQLSTIHHHNNTVINTTLIDENLVLTNREQEILKLVLKGRTNKEIASTLNITVRTTEKYVSRLLSKTTTRNRTELAQYFYSRQKFNTS